MLTWEEDVEAAALRAQGWSISAIARHLGRDRKTIGAYLDGERTPGQRRSSRPDLFAPFADYVTVRLSEDRHVWATALYDEVVALGYAGSYPSFTRALRTRGLRPRCEACAGVKGREKYKGHPVLTSLVRLHSLWAAEMLHSRPRVPGSSGPIRRGTVETW